MIIGPNIGVPVNGTIDSMAAQDDPQSEQQVAISSFKVSLQTAVTSCVVSNDLTDVTLEVQSAKQRDAVRRLPWT